MLALDTVDAVFVGAADLSMSMGSTPASPDVLDLVASAISAAHDAGKRCGLSSSTSQRTSSHRSGVSSNAFSSGDWIG